MTQRGRAAVFATGFFSLSQIPMMTLIVPLWALDIGASAFWIGMAIAARALLAMFFAIQTGAVMDRLGARRVTTAMAVTAGILVMLYPLVPSIGGMLGMQVIVGFLHLACWIGAQALVGRMTKGAPDMMGRFTFLTTLGNFLGPLMAGLAWQYLGAWGAFGMVSLWSAALVVTLFAVPKSLDAGAVAEMSIRDFIPRWAHYAAGFGLLRVPMIAYVIVVSAILAGVYAMRHTFLAVYLESINFSGGEIGFIVGSISLAGAFAGLAVGRLSRWMAPHWLVLAGTVLATVTFCLAPLFSGFWALLAVACATGVCSGTAFPMILSVLTRGAGTDQQGLSVGLRSTMNRTASLTVPVAMGAIVGATSLAIGFFIMGTIMVAIAGIMAIVLIGILKRQAATPAPEE
ncbi:MAG: MFS transporter [Rhodospirillaceae bacterium]|jgi:MFS family permease|nr:MFS transporter [Rhodospirillaceae bacterium]